MPGWTWAVVAGLAFGISQLSNRGLNRRIPAVTATTAMITSLFGFLVVAVLAIDDLGRLEDLTLIAVLWFGAAGVVHFLLGWTVFALSQQKVGPSRTAAILSANPVLAAGAAWLVLAENLRPVTWLGVVAVTAGVALVSAGRLDDGDWTNPALALTATLCFSISPLFVRWGLDEFDHPLLGLTVGMAVTVPLMQLTNRLVTGRWVYVPAGARRWLLSGGTMAALGITAQWIAFAAIPVGVAISLQQLSTPVVILIGPILLAAPTERATIRIGGGAGLIILGSVIVALFGRTL